jgi:ATP-dependent protease ClpP protease subunit
MADRTRPLSEEEKNKAAAEALRARAEAAKFAAETDQIKIFQKAAAVQLEADKLNLLGLQVQMAKIQRDFDELLTADKFHHVYYFNSPVDRDSVRSCMTQLSQWDRLPGPTGHRWEIVFNSPGGSVIDGIALLDFILGLRRRGRSIDTHNLSMAASMAGILLQAGERRRMASEAWLLIHEISFGAVGKIGEVEDTVEWVKRIQQRVLKLFADRCQQAKLAGTADPKKALTAKEIEKHWTRADWWVSSDEALAYGLIDEVV